MLLPLHATTTASRGASCFVIAAIPLESRILGRVASSTTRELTVDTTIESETTRRILRNRCCTVVGLKCLQHGWHWCILTLYKSRA